MARPANHRRDAEGSFPVRVFLAPERRHGAVRPRVHVRAVVGRVNEECVVGDAEIVDGFQNLSDIVIVLEHAVEIFANAAPAPHLWAHMGVEVHTC